jgi:hypothetical protein
VGSYLAFERHYLDFMAFPKHSRQETWKPSELAAKT